MISNDIPYSTLHGSLWQRLLLQRLQQKLYALRCTAALCKVLSTVLEQLKNLLHLCALAFTHGTFNDRQVKCGGTSALTRHNEKTLSHHYMGGLLGEAFKMPDLGVSSDTSRFQLQESGPTSYLIFFLFEDPITGSRQTFH